MTLNTDSSPFQSSPLDGTASPRLFWQNRNTENYGRGSPSPTRRSSIERLQKASRVKNSNILALEQKHEYDPAKLPQVERPLSKVQGNAFGATGISGYRDNKAFAHGRSESQTRIPIFNPKSPPPLTRSPPPNGPRPASREQSSPTKSSLATSRFKTSMDRETGAESDEASYFDDHELPYGRALHRHAKSVTFDAAPPQVNEYEMATPDVSSIATSSREGSYDSEDDEDDYDDDDHYNIVGSDAHEDSFDASLEDTVKTPVVLPDDWRQDSANRPSDFFANSPLHENFPSFAPGAMPQHDRSDSRNSNGDHRPLPPLPPPSGLADNDGRRNSTSSPNAERLMGSNRTLPSPPPPASPLTKADLQGMGATKMTLEERLKLMMLSDDGKSAAEQQRERRLRRAGTRDRADSQATEPEAQYEEDAEEEDTLGDISGLGELQLPAQISRESILRRVDGNKETERPSDYNFSSPGNSPERPLPLDPDVPIPSTEDPALDEDDSGTHLQREYSEDDDSVMDQYQESDSEVETISVLDDVSDDDDEDDDDEEATERSEVADKTFDSESNYSNPDHAEKEKVGDDQVATPRTASPAQKESSLDTVTDNVLNEVPISQKHNPFTDDLQSFMLPKPTEVEEAAEPEDAEDAHAPVVLQRPCTPEHLISKPEYDGSGWGEPDEFDEEEPKTPDSVIHRPLPEPEEEEVVPTIPETTATIKSAAGSKLKTRPSATPADIQTMREQRRHVSREVPDLASAPDRHLLSPSSSTDDYMMRHPSFKSRSLTLDLDLGLSLDQDFDRVIEAQKVAYQQISLPSSSKTSSQRLSRQASKPRLAKKTVADEINANITPRKQRGYLMRQNTKVVTASDKDTEDLRPASRSAGNSPVKQSRPQSWTVEPWNGQVRKKSLNNKKRPVSTGPVPPLPGRESNAAAMNTVIEEEAGDEVADEDSGERGRLFVKVLGVKDLDLPIPKSECIS